MMPIFFHLESHLWIAYALLLNGVLASWLLRSHSLGYRSLTDSFEALVLSAFFISLLLNGALLLAMDLFGQPFSVLTVLLPMITLALVIVSVTHFNWAKFRQAIVVDASLWRLFLYAFVFVVLFYNGGLIEQTSDAWWHMSLANKIGLESSFSLERGHLNGISGRYYPPLWHGNLALINSLSDIAIPVIWNSFTAWGAAFKVMAFYLLAWSLSRSMAISTVSVFLFILLPGVGDSYLRVSAWPSHIAYTAFFCCFYFIFYLQDSISRDAPTNLLSALKAIWNRPSLVLSLIALLIILTFTHLAELLWLAVALFFYCAGLMIYSVFSDRKIEPVAPLWRSFSGVLILAMLLCCGWLLFVRMNGIELPIDKWLAYALPPICLFALAFSQFAFAQRLTIVKLPIAQWALLIAALLLLVSVDLRHLVSLFNPELAYPKGTYPQYPLNALGLFGGELKVPGWHLQLRQGLLYSGIISLPLSVVLAFLRPSRLTLFLVFTANGAFLFCVSPYLHQWLRDILQYHSSWRIAILIFHPIIFATAIIYCWRAVFKQEKTVAAL